MVPSIVIFNSESALNSYVGSIREASEQNNLISPIEKVDLTKLIASKNELKLPSAADGYVEGDPWKFIFNINIVKDEYDHFFRVFELIKKERIDFHQFNQVHLIGYIDSQTKEEVKDFLEKLKTSHSPFLPVYCWFIEKHNLDEIFIGNNNTQIVNRFISFLTNSKSRKFIEKYLPLDKSHQQLPFFNVFGNSRIVLPKEKILLSLIEFGKFRNLQQYLYLSDECLVKLLNKDSKDDILNFQTESFDEFLSQNVVKVPEVDVSTLADLFYSDNNKYGFIINNLQSENVSQLLKDELSRKAIAGSIKPESLVYENTKTNISDHYIKLTKSNFTSEDQSLLFLEDLEKIFNSHKAKHFKDIEKELLASKDTILDSAKKKLDEIIKQLFSRKQKHNILNGDLKAEKLVHDYSNLALVNAFLGYLLNSQSDLVDNGLEKSVVNIDRIISDLKNKSDRCNEILDGKDNILKSKSDYLKRLQESDKAINEKRIEVTNNIFEYEKLIKKDNESSFFSRGKYTIKAITIATSFLICVSLLAIPAVLSLLDLITLKTSIFLIIFSLLIPSGFLIFKMAVLNQRIKNCENELKIRINNKKNLQDKIIEDQNSYFEARLDYFVSIFAIRAANSLQRVIQRKGTDAKIFWYYLIKKCTDSLKKYNDYEKISEYGEIQLLNKVQLEELYYNLNNEEYLLKDTDIIYRSFCEYETAGELQDKYFDPLLFNILVESEPLVDVPAKPVHESYCSYKKMDGKHVPFTDFTSKSVSFEDVKQGDLGDCYFLASLAAVACQQPDYLFRMIIPLEADSYKVRFFESDGNDRYIAIDSKFWMTEGNEPVYAKVGTSSENTREIWTMLIEKAWASINGGYETIEGDGQFKLEYSHALTGISSKCVSLDKNINKVDLRDEIISYFVNQKTPITLGSKRIKDAFCDDGLVTSHMYAISNVNKNGLMDIFNPWNIDTKGEGKAYKEVDIDFLINNFDVVFFMLFEDENKGYYLDMYLNTDLESRFKGKGILYLDEFFEKVSYNQGWGNIFENVTLRDLLISGTPFKIFQSIEFIENEIYRFSRPMIRKGWFREYNKLNEHLRYLSVDANIPQLIDLIRKRNSANIPYETCNSEECELTFYQFLTQFTVSDIV